VEGGQPALDAAQSGAPLDGSAPPRPSSLTVSSSAPSRWSMRTWALDAPLCLITLATASATAK